MQLRKVREPRRNVYIISSVRSRARAGLIYSAFGSNTSVYVYIYTTRTYIYIYTRKREADGMSSGGRGRIEL